MITIIIIAGCSALAQNKYLERHNSGLKELMRSKANKPFPSSPGPLFQNEGRCSVFDMEIIFHSRANKTHFHKKGCAPSLILKVRVFGTRKWPIDNVPPWYSLVQSKSLYESEDVQAFWDIPVFAGQTSGRKDSRSSSKDSNNSGNELPLDPGSREEIQAV